MWLQHFLKKCKTDWSIFFKQQLHFFILLVSLFLCFGHSTLQSRELIRRTITDFSSGTFSGATIDWSSSGNLRLSLASDLIVPGFIQTTPLPKALKNFSSLVYKGHIFIFGGEDENGNIKDSVYSAPIHENGTIEEWSSQSKLPDSRSNFSVCYVNERVYVIGGLGSDKFSKTFIFSAPLENNGSIGPWRNEKSLPSARSNHEAITYSNRIYVIGGHDSRTIPQSTVYSTSVLPDGSLENWREEISIPTILHSHSVLISNNYIYVIGGHNGTQAISDVYSAQIKNDGSLSQWSEISSLPSERYGHSAALVNGRIYVIGGLNNRTSTKTVFSAPVRQDESIGAWIPEETTFSFNISSFKLIYFNKFIYVLGGLGQSLSNRTYYARLNIQGKPTYPFSTQVNTINVDHAGNNGAQNQASPLIVFNNRIYVRGFRNVPNQQPYPPVPIYFYSASINPDGTIGSWRQEIRDKINSLKLFSHDGYIYGFNSFGVKDQFGATYSMRGMMRSPVEFGGTLGNFSKIPLDECPNNCLGDGSFFEFIVAHGRVYTFQFGAGYRDNVTGDIRTFRDIYSAEIKDDGNIGNWSKEGDSLKIDDGSAYMPMFSIGSRLYFLGEKKLYSVELDSEGRLRGSWKIEESGFKSTYYLVRSPLIINDKIYLFVSDSEKREGYNYYSRVVKIYSRLINKDGSLGSLELEGKEFDGKSDGSLDPHGVANLDGRIYRVYGGLNIYPTKFGVSGTIPLYSPKGTYESNVIDFGSVVRITNINWNLNSAPTNSSVNVSISVSTSVNREMSSYVSVDGIDSIDIKARYLKYRVELVAGGSVESPPRDQTPVLESITIEHFPGSLPPIGQNYSLTSNSFTVQVDNPIADTVEISTGDFSKSNTVTSKLNEVTVTNLTPNTKYAFYGRRTNIDDEMSDTVVLLSTFTKSASSSELVTQEVKVDSLKFTWSNNGNPDGTFYLAKLFLGLNDELLEEKKVNLTNVTFDKLNFGTKYLFQLNSVNEDGSLSEAVRLVSKTKELNPSNVSINVSTGSYILNWASQPEGIGFKVLNESNQLIAKLPSGAISHFESGFKENERISRKLEFYSHNISSTIANVTFFTAISPPTEVEEVLSVLGKGPTYLRLGVFPPPNPVGRSGVRVRIIPTDQTLASSNTLRTFRNGLYSDAQDVKKVDFYGGQWEKTIEDLTPGIQYSLVASYINSDGIESSPTPTSMNLSLSFSPIEEDIKPENNRFFINDGINFQISSNQSGSGTMKIFDVDQNQVRFISFRYVSGYTTVKWDGKDDIGQSILSGIYWVVIESAQFGRKVINVGAIQ